MPTITGLARIQIDGTEAKVYAPIWAKNLIKTMPERRWSPDGRAWVIPASDADLMRHRLEQAGYLVRTVNPAAGIRPPLRLRKDPAE